jgi:hypothetical protein
MLKFTSHNLFCTDYCDSMLAAMVLLVTVADPNIGFHHILRAKCFYWRKHIAMHVWTLSSASNSSLVIRESHSLILFFSRTARDLPQILLDDIQ